MLFGKEKLGLCGVLMALSLLMVFLFSTIGGTAEKLRPWENWSHYEKEQPVRGGYFRDASGFDVGLLNPNHWPVNNWYIIHYMLDKLLVPDGNYIEQPFLLQSYEYDTATSVIFRLREGVYFTDGTAHNAHSLKYLMDWIMDKSNGAWTRGWLKPLKSTEVIDKYTVRFTFKHQWSTFIAFMASVPGSQISPKALEADILIKKASLLTKKAKMAKKKARKAETRAKNAKADYKAKADAKAAKARQKADKLEKEALVARDRAKGLKKSDVNAVGTGKYIMEENRPGNYFKLKRNPNWWFGQSVGHPDMPYFDGHITTIIPDPAVRMANFRAKKIDSIGLDKASYAKAMQDHNLKVYTANNNSVRALCFNHTRKPFNDIRLRQAVAYAIDREALISGTQFGLGRIASCLYPEDHWAHNPNLKPWPYEPEKAKQLLAQAGFKEGLTVRGYMGSDISSVALTEAIKDMLKKVGIDWKVDNLSSAALSDRMKNLDYDLAAGDWWYIFDPDLSATGAYHPDGGFNFGRSNNPKAIELIMAGKKESDYGKRQQIYYKLEEALYNNVEDVWMWWEKGAFAYASYVRGYAHEGGAKTHKEIWGYSHPLWFKNGQEPER